jgi:hypothetical protein
MRLSELPIPLGLWLINCSAMTIVHAILAAGLAIQRVPSFEAPKHR